MEHGLPNGIARGSCTCPPNDVNMRAKTPLSGVPIHPHGKSFWYGDTAMAPK